MKFQIDTSLKIIKIEEKFKLKDLLKIMETMFPNDWQDYNIDTNSVINWNWPVVNCENCWYKHRYRQPYWSVEPYIYCGTSIQSTSGYSQIKGFQNDTTVLTHTTSDASHIINVETKDNGIM